MSRTTVEVYKLVLSRSWIYMEFSFQVICTGCRRLRTGGRTEEKWIKEDEFVVVNKEVDELVYLGRIVLVIHWIGRKTMPYRLHSGI